MKLLQCTSFAGNLTKCWRMWLCCTLNCHRH